MNQLPQKCSNCNTPVTTNNASFCSMCGQTIKLRERYLIIKEIADGVKCTVFKANDTAHFDREVVVKRFAPAGRGSQALREAEERCKHEAGILNSLNHHQIPDAYDCFFEKGYWYLVMKFMEGETLEAHWQKARKKTRLSLKEILSIGDELCSLLAYLHQHSIVFVDLKPSNVILGNGEHIDIVDFGSAFDPKKEKIKNFELKTTEGYAAPEISQGGVASPRSDIYSLGAILFQLVSGEKPSSYLLSSGLLPDRKLSDTLPELAKLIADMMQEDEANRPQDITVVQRELSEIKEKLTLPAASPQKGNMGRRNFLVGCLAGSLAVAGIGVGSAIWYMRKPFVQFPLTVGGKLDNEAALLTEMYVSLLRNAGFAVTDRARLGSNDTVFDAITTGEIDLYPEFLLTGLQRLGIQATKNPQQDFQYVNQGFQRQYQITWLDQATNLDDNYCVVMPRSNANQFGIKTLSDLALVIQKHSSPFVFAVMTDAQTSALPALQRTYGIVFDNSNVFQYDEKETFDVVKRNDAQVGVCLSTDPLIQMDDFVRLTDNRNALPVDTPSPIIRNEVLNMAPQITDILKPLSRLLSVDVSAELQGQMLNGLTAPDAASNWLKSQGLLS